MTDEQQETLDELVHEQASQLASNALNGGAGEAFLLQHGWEQAEIDARLGRDGGTLVGQ